MITKAIDDQAFIVRRLPCRCVIAISILDARAAADLFESYEDSEEFEIDIVPSEQARIAWTKCPHSESARAERKGKG
jgi:hypothetical protein